MALKMLLKASRTMVRKGMKIIFYLCLMLAFSCTQKYASFDLIKKIQFEGKENYSRPIVTQALQMEGEDQLSACFGQWLFSSNAENEKNQAIPFLVRSLCPGRDYLMNSEFKETWWTTLIYTRACISVETNCAK